MRISDWSSDVCSSDLDSADRQEPSPALTNKTTRLREKMNRLAALDAQMREAPDQQVSLTDPDSRSMATRFRRGGLRRAGSEIGRAWCRESVCRYVESLVVAGTIKKKRKEKKEQ